MHGGVRENQGMETTERHVAIVAYKPKPGCEKHLLQLAYEHVPLLREHGFVTDFPASILQAADGTLLEIFEWTEGGLGRAQFDPRMDQMWFRYAEVSNTIALNSLAEAATMSAAFKLVAVL